MDAIAAFADHVAKRTIADIPAAAIQAAKTFILDTCGVGICGSSGPRAGELVEAQSLWGAAGDARVWSTGHRLPAPAAALCNAYQVHNSEFDCVHEGAVAHVMSAVLPVALAGAERQGGVGGKRLIEAVVLGVDVAASLGLAASGGLRFFRPATAGAFGATAALGKIVGLDAPALVNAFSIAYGQLCGTMQAHTKGSMLLAMQMGFNARNAVVAADLARLGFEGPKNVLEGPFGYFRLIEAGGDPQHLAGELGRAWRIAEVAHKPFPSGRATHGIVDACLELQRRHSLEPDAIAEVTAHVPPLVQHLVGRPPAEVMEINYGRLCAAYVAARALRRGTVGIEDFTPEAFRDAPTQALARRIRIVVRDNGNPNALTPVDVAIVMRDGRRHGICLDDVYGSPARPMSRDAQLAKFQRNCANGRHAIPEAKSLELVHRIDALEAEPDVSRLVDLMVA